MPEYIEREPIIAEMQSLIDNVSYNHPYASPEELESLRERYETVIEYIQEQPTANVEPVKKWRGFGFEYSEPKEYGHYLTYYHGTVSISEWGAKGWCNEKGLPIDVEFWQPLGELPRVGE